MDNLGIGGIFDDIDVGAIVAASEKCDTEKLSDLSQKCSDSITETTRTCTEECQAFFDGVGESCGDLVKALGLEDIANICKDGTFDFNPISDIADNAGTPPADDKDTPTAPADDNSPTTTPASIGAGENIAENIEAGSNAIARSVSVGVSLAMALALI